MNNGRLKTTARKPTVLNAAVFSLIFISIILDSLQSPDPKRGSELLHTLENLAGTGYDKKTSSSPKSRLHPHGHRSRGREETRQHVQLASTHYHCVSKIVYFHYHQYHRKLSSSYNRQKSTLILILRARKNQKPPPTNFQKTEASLVLCCSTQIYLFPLTWG